MNPSASAIDNFRAFYEAWLAHQRAFLDQLLQALTLEEEKQLRLIRQVLAHYHQYYEHRSIAAREDVFRVFSAPWLTSYERTLLWISGFKPSIVFRLLGGAVENLSAAQAHRLQEVEADVRWKERELTEAMAGLQGTMTTPPFLELRAAMMGLMEGADMVRASMMKKVMEILSTEQTVKLLAAAAEFQLRIRRWGLQTDFHGRTT